MPISHYKPTISQLKRHLSNSDTVVPIYFYHGNRKEQIIHCRLRLQMSNLNSDLNKRHLLNNPACACGNPNETAEHFFFECPRFLTARLLTIDTLPQEQKHVNILLFGNKDLSLDENTNIFNIVHKYIDKSGRFWNSVNVLKTVLRWGVIGLTCVTDVNYQRQHLLQYSIPAGHSFFPLSAPHYAVLYFFNASFISLLILACVCVCVCLFLFSCSIIDIPLFLYFFR